MRYALGIFLALAVLGIAAGIFVFAVGGLTLTANASTVNLTIESPADTNLESVTNYDSAIEGEMTSFTSSMSDGHFCNGDKSAGQ